MNDKPIGFFPCKRGVKADKILTKLVAWKGSLVSIMGRVELVKTVIQSMVMHSFQVYTWPISLLKHLDKSISNFIWPGNINVRKVVTVTWHKLINPLLCLAVVKHYN